MCQHETRSGSGSWSRFARPHDEHILTFPNSPPFLCLGVAVGLCAWAFLRSEYYRAESIRTYSQTFEIQWRTTQIREHVARAKGHLRLAAETGRMEANLGRQIFLLNTNVNQLLKLEYVSKFLGDHDVELLREMQVAIANYLEPIAAGATSFDRALEILPNLEESMFEVSGTAVAHAETLNASAHIAEAASRNRFLFAVAVALAALGYLVIHLRNALARKQEKQLRSFSSLYAHMTRTRVAALKLFLSYQDETSAKHPEMLPAAREAVEELESITNRLGRIAYAYSETRRERFWRVLEPVMKNSRMRLDVDVAPAAGEALVPALQMRLILEEVMNNAEAALESRQDARIKIVARMSAKGLRRQRMLDVEIADNGAGMTPEVLARAKTPFFSTRSGPHTGLGLTASAQLLVASKGRFAIASTAEKGTSVAITIPV